MPQRTRSYQRVPSIANSSRSSHISAFHAKSLVQLQLTPSSYELILYGNVGLPLANFRRPVLLAALCLILLIIGSASPSLPSLISISALSNIILSSRITISFFEFHIQKRFTRPGQSDSTFSFKELKY